jgi:hypothetical protein
MRGTNYFLRYAPLSFGDLFMERAVPKRIAAHERLERWRRDVKAAAEVSIRPLVFTELVFGKVNVRHINDIYRHQSL